MAAAEPGGMGKSSVLKSGAISKGYNFASTWEQVFPFPFLFVDSVGMLGIVMIDLMLHLLISSVLNTLDLSECAPLYFDVFGQ